MSEKAPVVNSRTIGELERGGIGHAIDTSIAEAMADCEARPGLESNRTVTITLKFRPRANSLDQGRPGLGIVGVSASVKLATPARAGNEEYLGVVSGVSADGQPITQAVFTQPPLLRAGSN